MIDRTLLNYFGGKWVLRRKILPILPDHTHYVEPFGGSGAILLSKEPCNGIEVYNDKWNPLVNFFRVIAESKHFNKFFRRVQAIGYSRELWKEYRETWDKYDNPIEKALRWFVVARNSFSGAFGSSLSTAISAKSSGMSKTCSSWISAVNVLPQAHQRLSSVVIRNEDWYDILQKYQGDRYLAYCDPPYMKSTRSAGKYKCEMNEDDHKDLVSELVDYTGAVVLSGYEHPIYQPLMAW